MTPTNLAEMMHFPGYKEERNNFFFDNKNWDDISDGANGQ